jgi:hypothetical protein
LWFAPRRTDKSIGPREIINYDIARFADRRIDTAGSRSVRDWESEKRRREQDEKNRSASDAEAEKWYSAWEEWTPQEASRHFKTHLGASVFAWRQPSADGRKIVYRNLHTGWTLLVDVHNRYFTIHCPKLVNGQTQDFYVAKDGQLSASGKAAGFHFRIRR